MIVKRAPRQSTSLPASGEAIPLIASEIEKPICSEERDQPNSSSSGVTYSPSDQNDTPAATAMHTTAAASSHQP